MQGMKDSEYKACIGCLGLVEGEEIELQYVCSFAPPVLLPSERFKLDLKGLLVFTNDNMIFIEKAGLFVSRFGQRAKVPLEQITGLLLRRISVIGILALRIVVDLGTQEGEYTVGKVKGKRIEEVKEEIQKLLTEARQEKKRLAQEALARGTIPAMIFCKYCDARNKADQTKCANCGAVLT
ncbi:hypothetical protein KAU88_00730 [Candidatus Bathyarchaeota archaeon]|nr:hypothetical protein [Candidatus Bathyarchaeota archaeon]